MSKPKPEEQDTFHAVIQAIDEQEVDPDRHLSIQIDECVRDAIRAAQSSGQSAAVTIKVTIKPGPERRISFAANVNAKLPRPPVSAVTLYADDAGRLHHSNPDQLRMPFAKPTALHPTRSTQE